MSDYISIGENITFSSIREYISNNEIAAGNTILLNIADFEALIFEMRTHTQEGIELPIKVQDVLITSDTTDTVPKGKILLKENHKS